MVRMNGWWMDTLPSFRADAGEALVVLSLLTYSTVFTGSGAAGSQQDLTVVTCRQRSRKHRYLHCAGNMTQLSVSKL